MDRMYPLRRRHPVLATLLTAALLAAGPGPAAYGRTPTPILSDEPAGDPGDGVLRPADISPTPPTAPADGAQAGTSTAGTSATVTAPTPVATTFYLVPVINPAGQPWLTFRLVRLEGGASAGSGGAFAVGRWHRAP